VQLLPGGIYQPDAVIRINGSPSNTQTMRVEGQDSTNGWFLQQSETQPSVDAIQELSVQTSNYAAEFGQAGGGLFNATMKSGTNQFHGSAYEYFVNEALNAGTPFTNDGKGHLLRPRQRRSDYGFTVGGPIVLPKLYNGHDKAFFFFNFEQFRETVITNTVSTTVPTQAYRDGNFGQALTGRNLGTDPLGRSILENTVYNPGSDRVVAGLRERDPFPNNTVPLAQMDPVALKVQSLIPLATSSGLINNYLPTYSNPKLTYIPSVKVDYSISPKSKLSGYWSRTGYNTPNANVLPLPITSGVPADIVAHTIRLSFDQTLSPTLLLHFGVGLVDTHLFQINPPYDAAAQLGLKGTNTNLFPVFQSLSGAQGGLASNMGPGNALYLVYYKPTANNSLTWVRNNHTYKFGGEFVADGYKAFNQTYTNGWLVFNPNESGLPSLNGVTLAGTVGFNYASFLLGAVDNGYTGIPNITRMGGHALSGFAQDSWKVTRKLTLDYGLRYDFATYLKEEHGFYGIFSPSTLNPSAGGRPGAVIYEGSGGGRCNCQFAKNYPFAFGPRLGVAYQIAPKTVLRAGAGVSYYKTTDNNALSFSTGSEFIYATPSYGDPAYSMRDGLPYKISFPNFDPGQYPLAGTVAPPPQLFDQNAGKPARQLQWSVGVQREVVRNLLVEASYVGNRGVWWNAGGMIAPNANQPQALAKAGLDLNNAADRTLLAAPLLSSIAIARGFGPPYPGFPLNATVAQALRPFPQFGTLSNWHYVPDGGTWYNSLQAKATKRFSHGLQVDSSFTWAKQLTMGVEDDFGRGGGVFINDAFNRPNQKTLSAFDQPFLFVFSGNYTTPKLPAGNRLTGNKAVSWVARDWQLGTLLRYSSVLPIQSPAATSNLGTYLFQNTLFNRVPGVAPFTKDLNCHCFDPNTTFVLNPAAWVNPPAGQFGTAAAYYTDFRNQRRPVENLSLGRTFRFTERSMLQIRAEFTNIFNRTEVNNPTATNALATQQKNNAGQTTAGFGYINVGTTFSAPRQGTLVARFQF